MTTQEQKIEFFNTINGIYKEIENQDKNNVHHKVCGKFIEQNPEAFKQLRSKDFYLSQNELNYRLVQIEGNIVDIFD